MGDPCSTVTCNSPPATVCQDAWNLLVYSSPGACSAGTCTYGSTATYCPNGCSNGACAPCNTTTCANGCCSGNTCIDQLQSCRTGGNACPSVFCSGGRECIDGLCQCPNQPGALICQFL